MKKRNVIRVFVSFFVSFLFSITSILAEEDTNNLTLNTEILNNKKEEVNSNTTIEDVNLFSSDYQITLDNEYQEKDNYYKDITSSVFTMNTRIDNTTSGDIKMFENKVTFDKNLTEVTEKNDFMPIFLVAIFLLMIITYILTRRKYKTISKEEDKSANYNNIYGGKS